MTDVAKPATDTVRVTIDGRELDVPKGTLVIRAAEDLGITIPRFCDHPLLDPLGACRQCIVEVEGQRKPLTSCTTTCTDGMVVRTHRTSDVARDAQEGVLELLLLNHPLDCPQCDKGGECPLQDQALAHGPGESRLIDEKRRYVKPVPISPLVALDRERCVLCARCTRFSGEISGDPFIELFERGALEQVSIYADEPYHSYFSGNVVQICPVGALTDVTYRFKARPFDLRSHPSICNQCSAGCNLRLDVRKGEVQRNLARQNMAVNEEWNCDKGRFTQSYIKHPARLDVPRARNEVGVLGDVSWLTALRDAAARLRRALEHGTGAVAVLTGGRLTDEDSYALSRFTRDALGTDNVDFRLRPRTHEERDVLAAVAGTLGPTYEDVENAPVVVVAGLDTAEEVPILHLRLRKAWRRRKQKIVVVGPVAGSLADLAWRWLPTEAGGEAQVLAALADGSSSDVPGFDDVADALGAGGAIVLAGHRLAASPGALRAAAELARARAGAFAWVPRRNNDRGAVDAGLVPGLLPGGRRIGDPGPVAEAWTHVPDAAGLDTRGILEAAARGEIRCLYLVGVDIARDFEDPQLAREALQRAESVIVQDLFVTETAGYADVLLPAAAPPERVGSFTTWEGRRQPFPQAVPPQGLALPDWDILRQLASALGKNLGWETAADVRREAAPLMEVDVAPLDRLPASPPPPPATGVADDEFPLGLVVVDHLLGDGTLLAGADRLKETARPASVWVNETDVRRLGLADGQPATLVGPAGKVALPVLVTSAVAAGTVVVPGNSNGVAPGDLVPFDGPARVRLEAATGGA